MIVTLSSDEPRHARANDIQPGWKRCTFCQRVLELDEFHRDRGYPCPRCRNCKCREARDRYQRQKTRPPITATTIANAAKYDDVFAKFSGD